MLENLGAAGVFRSRHIAGFFEQRQIDVALGVAGRAGIAVPVPGAAEVAALLDDADVVDTGLTQPGRRQLAAESSANDDDLDVLAQRGTIQTLNIRVFQIVSELPRDLDILLAAVGANPPVAFGAVLVAQGVRVEPEVVGHGLAPAVG